MTALFRGSMPLHHQLFSLLREQISSRGFLPGEMLPTELALTKAYGVSRTVVRQAMQKLEANGLIRRVPGKGTLVRDVREEPFAGWTINSTDDLLQYGRATHLRVLECLEVPAPEHVAQALDIPPGTMISEIRSVRSAAEGAFAYQLNHILLEVGRKVAAQKNITSILFALHEHAHVDFLHMDQAISAVAAPADVARALDLPVGAPVLQFDWQLVATDGRKVTCSQVHYRSDRYRHVVRLFPGA